MRIITVSNQKGGCGKTTTVINLGASLGQLGRKVLIIDMDPQGHAGIGLGILPDQITRTMYDVLCNDSLDLSLRDIILPVTDNLFLAPSNITLSALEQKFSGLDRREEQLKNCLIDVYDDYDYILIDTPPSVGLLTFNALRACREVIIPIDSSYFGLHGLGKLLETIIVLNERLNNSIRFRALATLYDKRTKVSIDVLQSIQKLFSDKTFNNVISLNVKLKEAVGLGLPVIDYDPDSAGAQDYMNLAKEIIEEENDLEIQRVTLALKQLDTTNTKEAMSYAPKFVDGGILFSLKANQAKTVMIAGDFNNWTPDNADGFNRDDNGIWSKILNLNPGLYQYKLIIDGRWVTDPNNPIKVQSPFGGSNSVLVVK